MIRAESNKIPIRKRVLEYTEKIRSGEILACEALKGAVDRFYNLLEDDRVDWRDHVAQKFIDFFEVLPPGLGDAPYDSMPHELFFFFNLYAPHWKYDIDDKGYIGGDRVYREALLHIARKNNKTGIGAKLALGHILIEKGNGKRCINISRTTDQADLLTEPIKAYLKLIDKKKRITTSYNQFFNPVTNSKIISLAADGENLQGYSPSISIVDESHTFDNSTAWKALSSGMGNQYKKGFTCFIHLTTAGIDMNKPYYNYLQIARKVALGEIEREDFLVLIYEMEPDKGDKWDDITKFIKSNPALGISTSKEYIQQQIKKGKLDEEEKVEVEQKLCNYYTSNVSGYLRVSDFDKCKAKFDPKDLKGKDIYLGLDLGQTNDLCSLYVVCYDEEVEKTKVWGYNFCPTHTIEEGKNSERYKKWEKEGFLIRTFGISGKTTDHNMIADKIIELSNDYNIKLLSYDPYASQWILDNLVNQRNFDEDLLDGMRQSMPEYTNPMKHLLQVILDQTIEHLDDLALRFAVGNAIAVYDGNGNSKLMKNKSLEKIDMLVSLVMAFRSYLKFNAEEKQSAYNNPELLEKIESLTWDD